MESHNTIIILSLGRKKSDKSTTAAVKEKKYRFSDLKL
jgi:hypothetical protein